MIILVVDDDAGMRTAIDRLLKSNGHHVVQAFDSEVAVTVFEDTISEFKKVDLMITDLNMPSNEEGFSLLRQIHKLCSKTRMILMSGIEGDKTADEAKDCGAEAFVLKTKLPDYLRSNGIIK